MINKGCEVNHDFKNGFILNEEHLQTLSSMIRERYTEELIYQITKSDSYIFQTSDINEIIKEENSSANLINKMAIIIDDDNISFILCFEKGEATFLRIIGEDKDKIFLLYNEIKTYVEKEITTVKTFLSYDTMQNICSVLSSFLMIGSILLLLIPLSYSRNNEGIDEAINSSDVLFKLNYLINQRGNTDRAMEKYMYIIFPIMVIAVILVFVPKLLRFLWGQKGVLRITDYFLFGKQKKVYDKKIKIKNNIVWTVDIGFLVSILAGLVIYFVTN